jgi:hypothetical protein
MMLPAQPVYVFVPMADAAVVDFSGTFSIPANKDAYRNEIVGLLHGFELYHDQAEWQIQIANDVLRAYGAKVEPICRALYHPKNDVQSIVCYGVFMPSMEEAEKLPGFTPIFLVSSRETLADLVKSGPSNVGAVN